MDLATLSLYVVAASAVTITPGPTMLLALNNGAYGGKRVAACGIAGAALSDLILISAVACGLGTLLIASEQLFTLVKWAGAAYLLYLATVLWRAPVRSIQVDASAVTPPTGRAAFVRSLLVALSNPKGLLFFSAFLPQFIRPDDSIVAQYLTLAIVTAAIDIALMSVYAVGGYHSMRILSGRAMRWLNRTCAGILAGLGVALSLYRRSEPN
ncbi:threonine/homoserine/homoserine lactone efflux protein [Chromobacterium alkanivorans]|uniref:LysE family translocator n=1 Tax=Chromobacterium alkanivorans TaxID=1071719 RepID=UPI00216826B8|nr:LysE family translocator [Chromobacterium alkanivorans]MCS3802390.1 threonine/homoserine/homoserine lactone efflux protein [Chromobacterium alkanivorans]MCS3816717.1 threonine/homoserine/homoserine lactone efflux protein [Chromobacterium alkanivorans]MCS3871756.1 threonine/homoserine/homoserine lactone efflux protein [Chromobacterium alkanivorans]